MCHSIYNISAYVSKKIRALFLKITIAIRNSSSTIISPPPKLTVNSEEHQIFSLCSNSLDSLTDIVLHLVCPLQDPNKSHTTHCHWLIELYTFVLPLFALLNIICVKTRAFACRVPTPTFRIFLLALLLCVLSYASVSYICCKFVVV